MIGAADSVKHIDTTSHYSSINKSKSSNSTNDIKDNTYFVKETETFE